MSDPRWKAPYRKARAALDAKSKRCHWCGRRASEADHLVPVAKGGTDDASNLVPSCRSCNARRGSKSVEEWQRVQRQAAPTIFPRRRGPITGDYSRRPVALRPDYTR